jgi:glycerophosphoryl diester phosphodiesterase
MERPLIIAHRGACTEAPENTLAAFALAASQGASMWELDVRRSADGQLVVFHDRTTAPA